MSMKTATKMYESYWKAFGRYLEGSGLSVGRPKRNGCPSIIQIRTGVDIVAIVSKQKKNIGVELLLEKSGDSETNKTIFSYLQDDEKIIEKELGFSLVWENNPQKKRSKIFVYNDGDYEDIADLNRQHKWLKETIEKFDRVFSERLKRIKAS